jgi:AraC-like DNA-binding protein
MDTFLLEKLASLMKIPVISKNGEAVTSISKSKAPNPLILSESLQRKMIELAAQKTEPLILRDDFQVYFASIKDGSNIYLIGPMATEVMDFGRRRAFYRSYGYKGDEDRGLKAFSLREILDFVEAAAVLITGVQYADDRLTKSNHLVLESKEEDSILFNIRSEEEDIFRHSYQEERRLLDEVRNGNPEGAVEKTNAMDREIGRLGSTTAEHWRNMLVIAATLCARAAIEGGIPPYIAYRTSGYYINKGSHTGDITKIIGYRDQVVRELAALVKEQKGKKHTSSYTLQIRDYVMKHYRDKIYLSELAVRLGISESYLSRLFKRETGMNLTDYVAEVRVERAANLLKFSDESIPRIAEYVGFPSQSYFGRLFKKSFQMTPREYREAYKPLEFDEAQAAEGEKNAKHG